MYMYLYTVLILDLYFWKKPASTPRAATVRMFSMESTASLPALSSAFLLLAVFQARMRAWNTEVMTRTGMTLNMKKAITQE